MKSIRVAVFTAGALCVGAAVAAAPPDYLRRAAQQDEASFRVLDRDQDGRLTLEEARGNNDWQARFNDIDINRDGVITREELARYIAARYGIALPLQASKAGEKE